MTINLKDRRLLKTIVILAIDWQQSSIDSYDGVKEDWLVKQRKEAQELLDKIKDFQTRKGL